MVITLMRLLASLAVTSCLIYFNISPSTTSSTSTPSPTSSPSLPTSLSSSSSPVTVSFSTLPPTSSEIWTDTTILPLAAERVTRDLSQLVQPHKTTVLVEPQPRPCLDQQDLKLVVAVFSAPGNYLTRAVVRETWAPALSHFQGVELVFFLGRDPDLQRHVRFLVAIRNSSKYYSRHSLSNHL